MEKAYWLGRKRASLKLAQDASSSRARLAHYDLAGRYSVRLTPLEDQPWGMRDFTLTDPAGVCWRIGQNLPPFKFQS